MRILFKLYNKVKRCFQRTLSTSELMASLMQSVVFSLYCTLTHIRARESKGLKWETFSEILRGNLDVSRSGASFWWDVSSQDCVSYELLKICRCDRAPREAGWSEFSVGCFTRSINKWTHQWMSEGNIRGDTLRGLRMKKQVQSVLILQPRPMSLLWLFYRGRPSLPHVGLDKINLTVVLSIEMSRWYSDK